MHHDAFFNLRKLRREIMLRKMKSMRAAKARKRLENPPEHEPKMKRTACLSIGFRDEITGHTVWLELTSARQAYRIAGVLLKHYSPGFPI